jgi:CRP-like cAMP-binding protein
MPEVSNSLLRILKRKIYQKDAVIFREGDQPDYAYIIRKGSVFIAKQNQGDVALLTKLVDNQMFGELALFEGKPRSATAIAAESTELLLITPEQFQEKVGKLSGFMRYLVSNLSERIFDLSSRVQD